MSKQILPREAAIRALALFVGAPSSSKDSAGGLDSLERSAWLQDVVLGTTRYWGRIQFILAQASLKKRPTGWINRALSVAVYQMLAQDRAPVPAVISETVDCVKAKDGLPPSKFTNAVLRKVAGHLDFWRGKWVPREESPVAEWAAWASMPVWLWNQLVADHGREWAREFAVASLERPRTWLSVDPARVDAVKSEMGDALEQSDLLAGTALLAQGAPAIPDLPGFQDTKGSAWIVQDVSSQRLVAEVSAEWKKQHGSLGSALDLCASPGGKAVGLAWQGWKVSATDLPGRWDLLRGTVDRCGLQSRVALVARDQVRDLSLRDLVWVDAPCAGTGIIRRHPDIRWQKTEKDVAALRDVQVGLIREAWERVRPGGALVYSVCSVLKSEGIGSLTAALGEGVVESQKRREWFLVPQDRLVDSAPGGDGFWAAWVEKPLS